MMGMLGRILVETQIAPKREKWKLFPHRRGVDELGAWSPNECLVPIAGPRRPLTTDKTTSFRARQRTVSHARNGMDSHGHAATGWERYLTLVRDDRSRDKILHWGTAQLEMPTELPNGREQYSCSLL